jgi:murein DD-endopeptidase MepM/ murein hydrolase activator NlpD
MDSSKFFNRKINVRDPKTPYQKGKVVEESKNYSSRVFSRVKETSTTKSLLSIRRKVFQIENSLQSIFNLNKKSDKVKQRFAVVELEEERNNKKLSSPATGLGNLIQRPKTGAMDMIKNFVTFTFLGWLFTTLQPLIGKLEWVFPLLKGAFDFIGGTVKFLVESLGSFIKFGYDAKDKFDEIAGNIKKETKGVDKHFDNVLNELKSVFSGAVEVVNSFLDISVDAEELKNARNELNEDSFDVAEIPLPLAPDFSQLTQVSPSIASASNINGGMLDNDQTGNSNENSSSASVTSPTIEAAATGGHIGQQGRIDPKKTPITRGPLQQRRRELPKKKPNIQSQKTAPGKDVGGEDKVKEIYGEKISTFKPDFIPMGVIWGSDEKSGYSALIKSSNEYKKPNADDILGIGNLMGATVDTVLGQKPERRTYTQFADGIRYLVDRGITYPEEFKRIDLEIMLRRIIEPKIEAAIGKIREEVNKKSREKPTDGGLDGGGGGLSYKFKPGAPGSRELQEEVEKAALELGIPAPDLLGVILAESGGDPSNTNQFGCTGLIQFCPGPSSGQAVVGKTGEQLRKMGVREQMKYVIKYLKTVGVKPGMSGYDVYSAIHAGRPGGNIVDRNNVSTRGYYESNVKPLIEQAKRFSEIQESASMVEGGTLPSLKLGSRAGPRWGRMHNGNDYPMPPGTPISLAVGGEVTYASSMGDYGNTVDIRHPDGSSTRYAHLQRINVRVGQKVNTGSLIGTVGYTGRTVPAGPGGSHLHFEYRDSRGKVVTDWQRLNQIADRKFRFGGNVRPSNVPSTSTSDPQRQIPQTPRQQPQFTSFRQVGDGIINLKPGQTLTVNGVGRITKDKNGTPIYHVDGRGQVAATIFKAEFEKRVGNASQTQTTEQRSQQAPIQTPGQRLQQAPIQAQSIIKALVDKGEIPVTVRGETYYFKVRSDGTYDVWKPGPLGIKRIFGQPIDISESTNLWLQDAIKAKIDSMYVTRKYGGLVYKNGTSPILPEEKYASYNDPSSQMTIAIQPIIIQTPIPVSSGSKSSITFSLPSVNSNNNAQHLMR